MKKSIISLFAISMLVAGCSGPKEGSVFNAEKDTSAYDGARYTRTDGSYITPGTAEEFAAMQNKVFFEFDQSTLSSESITALRTQAQWLNFYPGRTITVEGHADERGTREYNLALGERRANAVKDFLISQGISSDRITTISYGKERPEVAGSNSAAWAKNRRAASIVTN